MIVLNFTTYSLWKSLVDRKDTVYYNIPNEEGQNFYAYVLKFDPPGVAYRFYNPLDYTHIPATFLADFPNALGAEFGITQ